MALSALRRSLSTELSRFPNAELVWCQEEPKNMGGWTFVDPWLELTLDRLKIKAKRARYVGRPASASCSMPTRRPPTARKRFRSERRFSQTPGGLRTNILRLVPSDAIPKTRVKIGKFDFGR